MHRDGILVALSIKGVAKTDAVAAAVATAPEAIERELEALEASGAAEPSKIGWRLTAAGRALADAALAVERAALDRSETDARYEDFCELNDRFKRTIVAWQLREAGGKTVPNDHSDAAYDARVLRDLESVDRNLQPLLEWLAARVPRSAAYRERFEGALAKALRGERRFVAAPLIDSYHTVWFEFHEELIRLSGRTRAAEAAAGRGV
jgi:pyruvate,orthophosphate dikinase